MQPVEAATWLTPRLAAAEAGERLRRGRFGRRRRLAAGRTGRLELVGLPCIVVSAGVRLEGRTEEARCLVDRAVGRAAWIEGEVAVAFDRATRSEGPAVALPASLSVSQCETEAERFLSRRIAILQRGRRWSFSDSWQAQPVVYPYWVLYYRRGRRWDLRVADAITGEDPGAIGRRGVVTALVQAERACEDRSDRGAVAAAPESPAEGRP